MFGDWIRGPTAPLWLHPWKFTYLHSKIIVHIRVLFKILDSPVNCRSTKAEEMVVGRFVYLYCFMGWDHSYTLCGPPGVCITTMNCEINQQHSCTHYMLIQWFQTRIPHFYQNSPCETSAKLLHSRGAADVRPAYTPPPSLVWFQYTNHPFGHQRKYTKRLIIEAMLSGRRL